MTTSHRQFTRIGALVLLLTVGLTVGIGPAMAMSDTAPPPSKIAAESSDVKHALEDAQVPTGVDPGDQFTVDATAISARDDVTDVCWKFDENDTCHDAKATHTFETAGPHTATLIVIDDNGERSSKTYLVTATTAPTATLSASKSVNVGTTVQLDANDSTDDFGIESYEWDLDGDGTVDKTTTTPTLSHTFESAGTYEVTVTAIDEARRSDTASATITVANPRQSGAGIVDGITSNTAIPVVLVAIGAISIGTYLFARTQR